MVTCKRMKFYIYCTKYTKINLKQIKNSDVRPKTIKLLKKKNGGKMFLDTDLGGELLDMTPKAQATKMKITQRDCITEKK